MISEAALAHWQQVVPWTDPAQVEQDLVLTRMIVEIARHPALDNELVFRALDNLGAKLEDRDFARGLDALGGASATGYALDQAHQVAERVIRAAGSASPMPG